MGNRINLNIHSNSKQFVITKQFIWIGNRIAEERDANNNVVRRFFPQGEQINGANYYYTRDHLGSIRELVDSTNAIRARYDYDPYGYRFKLSGDLDSEFGYTGFYYHQPSGLNLAVYRAYDSSVGRWLSRDPVGERPDTNLYVYVANDPLRYVDFLGLEEDIPPFGVGAGTQSAQNRAKDAADLVNAGSEVAYPSEGKGFFKPPSPCDILKALLKFFRVADQVKTNCDKDPQCGKQAPAQP